MSARSSPLSDVPADMDADDKTGVIKNEASLDAEVKLEEVDGQKTPESNPFETPVPATPKTPKRSAPETAGDESPVKKTKGRASPKGNTPARQRKAPTKTPNSGRAIATSKDELSAEDRLLLSMKDQGKSWKEIGEAWAAVTGTAPAKSTLPNRYARLRANITTMSEADQQNLIEAKAYVEQKQEQEKWEQIAQRMQELGSAEKFSITVLQKQLQKMEVAKAQTPVNPFEDVAE
ncbi:uncharacterized protein LTHEOB_3429 [Lasiodiplodia theobromae]|uniref:uncharacterized protein n=1 Tax=Lasiodiplodia theobromae TaxID=45133 RepID=UPI0015C2C7C1|nr:uncharacterized protein LTHEOB_3429 [Lasiodiplodia theobromae]KAF4533816.1 hypothetical protein LTHEOB_3429 [Lasiodiplodia theobromae]